MKSVLDQADHSETTLLDADVLRGWIQTWKEKENDGEDPAEDEEEATGLQLTALHARLQSGLVPFADFGVWRPFGHRLGR
eukprot:11296245-Karenia_brevis.AAC.1